MKKILTVSFPLGLILLVTGLSIFLVFSFRISARFSYWRLGNHARSVSLHLHQVHRVGTPAGSEHSDVLGRRCPYPLPRI